MRAIASLVVSTVLAGLVLWGGNTHNSFSAQEGEEGQGDYERIVELKQEARARQLLRRRALPSLTLTLDPESAATPETLVVSLNASSYRTIREASRCYQFFFPDFEITNQALVHASARQDVLHYAQDVTTDSVRKTNDPNYVFQWHLENTAQTGGVSGIDLNTNPVWDSGITGATISVAVVDDAVEIAHEDLAANIDLVESYDYVDDDADPTPVDTDDEDHGTGVAGIIAAVANNGLGVAGVAYGASLIGLRTLDGNTPDATEALALGHHLTTTDPVDISNNSWGPPDAGDYEDIGPLAHQAILDGVTNGRGGLGIIYCWAGGNGRDASSPDQSDNSNTDGYANLPETIAVGSCTKSGSQASYSESGANILVVTPGSEDSIATTDLTGAGGGNASNYRSDFNGTSSATPMVAGVAALMLEANPALSWRDVQYILAHTSTQLQPALPSWHLNGGNYTVSHDFGFGLVNAEKAVEYATAWTPVSGSVAIIGSASPGVLIPDNTPTPIESIITDSNGLFLEHVEVEFTTDHPFLGDLNITLTSPAGTVSQLAVEHIGLSPASGTWTFMSVHHWGESSSGAWTLSVQDLIPDDDGTFVSWSLILYGSQTQQKVPVTLDSASLATGTEGEVYTDALPVIGGISPYLFSITSGSLPPGVDLDPVTGELTGTPTTEGSYGFTVDVSTAETAIHDEASFTINVSAASSDEGDSGGSTSTSQDKFLLSRHTNIGCTVVKGDDAKVLPLLLLTVLLLGGLVLLRLRCFRSSLE